MNLEWADIEAGTSGRFGGAFVELSGFFVAPTPGPSSYGALVAEAACCGGDLLLYPQTTVEVSFAAPVDVGTAHRLTLAGRWREGAAAAPWRFRLEEARVVAIESPLPRRLFLGAAALGLVACSAGPFGAYSEAASPAAPLTGDGPTIDIHSHAGQVIIARRDLGGAPRAFTPLAAPMKDGGMNVVCLAIVADTPTTRVSADGQRFEPYRAPAPGELYEHGQAAFARAAALIEQQGLHVVVDIASLRAAPARGPSVIVASEGADFLEGRLERVDEAWRVHRLRHLQLTHYRVNELGDIQTEPPVHGGLTDFGAAVIERCNALGIVVDVAHGPFALVERAARVTTRPLVLSHTSLAARPGPRSRQITVEHARLIADTGGVVGVWPNGGVFADLDAMARGARRLADAIGAEHVGLGSDMLGFITPPVFRSYRQLPAYAQALRGAGFTSSEVEQVLGANYRRVFEAVLGGAPQP